MGYYNDLSLSYSTDDAALDRRDGPPVLTPRQRRADPMIALAAPYRTAEYSIYHSAGEPDCWVKRHASSFATWQQAQRALKRLGWLRGNGMHHCIIPATAETLEYRIGLELLYGRAI